MYNIQRLIGLENNPIGVLAYISISLVNFVLGPSSDSVFTP